jgi:hypothetical protein
MLVHSRCRGFLIPLDHTQTHTTVGRTPLDEGSARRRDLYLTTQKLYKRQIFMPPVGFEHRIPASARPQTYTLDRAATGIGFLNNTYINFKLQVLNKGIIAIFVRFCQDADLSLNIVCLSDTATSPPRLFSLQSKRRHTGEPDFPLP